MTPRDFKSIFVKKGKKSLVGWEVANIEDRKILIAQRYGGSPTPDNVSVEGGKRETI